MGERKELFGKISLKKLKWSKPFTSLNPHHLFGFPNRLYNPCLIRIFTLERTWRFVRDPECIWQHGPNPK